MAEIDIAALLTKNTLEFVKGTDEVITAQKKKRGANWSAEEEIYLIEEVLKYEDQLFGKMKGSGVRGKHGRVKDETWRGTADTLSGQFKNERTAETISKKYDNIKQRAKDKIDALKRPKTGGGPAKAPLTAAEECLLQAFDGRPNIVRLNGGIDSDEPSPSSTSLPVPDHADTIMEVLTGPSATCSLVEPCGDGSRSHNILKSSNGRKNKKNSRHDIIEEADRCNLELENQVLKSTAKKLKLEREKLKSEIKYMHMQKEYLLLKISKEFPGHNITLSQPSPS
ncbi:uncharacterized protein LOC133194936 [Saccostrea echinata]|uniref:uncharacterized protein LOC133194936 n=1 Tax=Saccostrea echinata TaxID=191078 RepID=UPI002A7F54DA|nr:uncharacterized protein LOC133194936 [Saccostrea echinata]